jgi:hypothetical protein
MGAGCLRVSLQILIPGWLGPAIGRRVLGLGGLLLSFAGASGFGSAGRGENCRNRQAVN